MATVEEVEATIDRLIRSLENVDQSARAMLPSRRTIEARCPDLGLVYHAEWQAGKLGELHEGSPPKRADIRIEVDSEDLMAMAKGDLDFRTAYQRQQVRVDASMRDLLRLRAAL